MHITVSARLQGKPWLCENRVPIQLAKKLLEKSLENPLEISSTGKTPKMGSSDMSQKSNLDLKWFFKRFFSQLNWHPAIIIIFVDSTVGIDHSHFAFKRSVIQALIFTTGP